MKTAIICNGHVENYEPCKEILSSTDYVICADGGTLHAYNLGLVPDIIMGDMDSSGSYYLEYFRDKGVEFKTFSSDKDKTDTELCLEYALGFSDEVYLLGATGARLDHTLANVSILKLGLDKDARVWIIDEKNKITMIKDKHVAIGKKGDLFSLIPMSEKVEGITTKGAHYELENAVMVIGSSYGVSNYFEDNQLEVSIKNGYLLFICSRD